MFRKLRQVVISFAIGVCALAGAVLADPGGHKIALWQVDGDQNRVYLLGSIHLLRESDYPLSPLIYDALDDAEVIYMELDFDDLDAMNDQMLANQMGLFQDGESLASFLGRERYAEAARLAESAQIPLQLLDKAEPWYAAIQVELMMLMRLGFNPMFGVESHLAENASEQGKEILGLETTQQQLELLDNLSAESQIDMFMQTLEDSPELADTMDLLIEAWHNGDMSVLEENMLEDMQAHEELNEVIVVNRNRDWAEQLSALLDDSEDYLVVVGALHLIGEMGVPSLLKERGYTVTQLQQDTR